MQQGFPTHKVSICNWVQQLQYESIPCGTTQFKLPLLGLHTQAALALAQGGHSNTQGSTVRPTAFPREPGATPSNFYPQKKAVKATCYSLQLLPTKKAVKGEESKK